MWRFFMAQDLVQQLSCPPSLVCTNLLCPHPNRSILQTCLNIYCVTSLSGQSRGIISILIRPGTPVWQTPVPPLQRAADVTPVFNQILMNEQEEEYDGPPPKEIPALIVWTLGGKNVYVEGSWDNWKSRYSNPFNQDCNF